MFKKQVIVFEGVEGSGKSFHLNNVCSYLKKKKIPFLKLREPGGSENSEKIRKLILNNKSSFNKNTDLLLYLASRSENIPLLKKNYKKKIIIIDRFIDSTKAYQYYGLGVNYSLIQKINDYLLDGFKVDFTFLNIVSNKNMIKRLNKRMKLNRYDKFNKKFYSKVQNGFLKISKQNKKKYLIIDSNLEMKENNSKNWKQMEWAGFYFEYWCNQNLKNILEMPYSKKYGNVTFDAFFKRPWDFKCHAIESGKWAPINDYEAISKAIDEFGCLGIVLAECSVNYDNKSSDFKNLFL